LRSGHCPARLLLAFLGLAFVAGPVNAAELRGRVVGLADGDTLTVLDEGRTQHRVRIAGIDAPERGQPGAQRSKDSLAALVHEQPVRVEWHTHDRHGRIVGKVWVAAPNAPCRGKPDCPMTLDAGLAQITTGRAWWSRTDVDEQPPEDRAGYASAEQQARAAKAGLWRDGTAVPPWEWRARRVSERNAAATLR
jgi:endonuclease YncB( thermonuclease family)